MFLNSSAFYGSLTRHPNERTDEDVSTIYNYLRKLEVFEKLHDAPLRSVCRTARMERHHPNYVLFRKGQVATCWYILLSGSVFMNKQIYLPVGCFGKRSNMNLRRNSDCIVIQPSDMIVIDYPDVQRITVHHHHHNSSQLSSVHSSSSSSYMSPSCLEGPSTSQHQPTRHTPTFHRPAYIYNRVPSPAPAIHPRTGNPPPWYVSPPQPPPKPSNMAGGARKLGENPTLVHNHARSGSVSDSYSLMSSSSTINVPSPSSFGVARRSFHQENVPQRNVANIVLPLGKESGTEELGEGAETTKPAAGSSFGSSNFQRLSKMRLNFTRRESEDNGTTVKVRAFPSSNTVINTNRSLRARSTASSSTTDGDEFSGLPETAVDSDDEEDDEESCPSHDSFQELRDNVRECLEKEPAERNADDISVLMDFMQQMPALASLPLSIKRQLCLKMVFAIVPSAGTVIMQHNERVDAWSVVVNGAVEQLKPSGERVEYRLGDCFGAEASPQLQYHQGEMRTMVNDCEFVLVEHSDYCSIMSTLNQHIEREADSTGEVVREAERRVVGKQVELLIIKALPERLILQLVEEGESVDAHFLEDFLLMYRVFIVEPTSIMHKLLGWFAEAMHRDRIARIILLWVNNHFNDFESDKEMTKMLDAFESLLESACMHNQLSLVNITCSVKSKPRTVILTRSNREQELAFNIMGGLETSQGIFISEVEPNSMPDKNGLKRGDEILEVNGQSFKHISLTKALDVLRESTHLSLTAKSNLMGFKEMLIQQEELGMAHPSMTTSATESSGADETDNQHHPSSINGTVGRYQKKSVPASSSRRSTLNYLTNNGVVPSSPPFSTSKSNWPAAGSRGALRNGGGLNEMSSTMSIGSGTGKASMFEKLFTLLKGSTTAHEGEDVIDEAYPNALRASRSNPDISAHSVHPQGVNAQNRHSSFSMAGYQCEQAVKVHKSDQSFRYLTIYPETTAKNIVQLALQEFGMTITEGTSLDWSLCECTVTREGVIKQRRLPDEMNNLAEKIGLSSRFYLKNNTRSENLLPDDQAPEVLKESRTNLYTLNAQFLATQLTLQDFAVFSSIEPTEYVNSLFQLESRYGWPQLTIFEDLFNKEMWWVVTEVCIERNVYRRSKLIKKFIKIARHCRELRNFNSMFAIVSGLEKPAVRRLSHSWERVSGKYMKMYTDIQQLMDPSRNMSKYRQHLAQVALDPPVIPIYPVLRKDLTFSHEANPTYSGKLVNFEKLRMIARIIRSITRLCSVQYDVDYVTSQMAAGMDLGTAETLRHQSANAQNNWSTKQSRASNPKARMIQALGNGFTTTSTGQSRKKLYERTLMLRKVKAYLANLPVIDQESELDKLSLDCEPPAPGITTVGGGGSSAPPRRRMPSPSPSSLSSHSNQSAEQRQRMPKFGIQSPQAVQKMNKLVLKSQTLGPSNNIRNLAPSQQLGQSAKPQPQIRRVPSMNAAELPPLAYERKRSSLTSNEKGLIN